MLTHDELDDYGDDEEVDVGEGPEDEDLVTTDHRTVYAYRGTGKVLLHTTPETFDNDVTAYMDRTRFWPNVWFISDHGNAHLLTFKPTLYCRVCTPDGVKLAGMTTLCGACAAKDPTWRNPYDRGAG